MGGIKMERRKVIEIYATEDLENMKVNFEVERLEDSKISNLLMAMLHETFLKNNPKGTKVSYEEE